MPDDRGDASVADLAARDPEGFASRAWKALAPALYGSALRILRSAEEAEDVLQDSFVKMLAQPPEIPEGSLPAWMRRVVVNGALDVVRRRKRWAWDELDETSRVGASRVSSAERLDLERAMAELPERARLVLVLHDVEGLKHTEVAELLGVTAGTSKSQLSRARGLMREKLGAPARIDESEGGAS